MKHAVEWNSNVWKNKTNVGGEVVYLLMISITEIQIEDC